jgi:hypothetical protein
MDASLLVARGETERLHDPQTEFVFGHAIVTGVQNGAQDRAAQEADEKEVVEVTRLKRSVLAIICEAEELAFLFWNAAVVAVHPFQSSRNQKRSGRTSTFT